MSTLYILNSFSYLQVISTTTINPIPTNYFPIHAKDLLAAAAASTTTAASLFTTTQTKTSPTTLTNNSITLASSSSNVPLSTTDAIAAPQALSVATTEAKPLPTHGRRLRQRPQKNSPNTSRRSSVSSNQSSASSTSAAIAAAAAQTVAASQTNQQSHEDLKQTVNKYFGIVNRIESGEQFSIRAKRQLANGQMQYLIEWGEVQNGTPIKAHAGNPVKDATQQLSNLMETETVCSDKINEKQTDVIST